MLYMLKLQISAGKRDQALAEFERRGPNRNPGVKFRGAWIAVKDDTAYALVEGTDEPAIENACQAWSEYGQWSVCPVVDIEKY